MKLSDLMRKIFYFNTAVRYNMVQLNTEIIVTVNE